MATDDMKGNFEELLQQAQKMQEKMVEAQKELTDMKVEGTAGAGAVKITMNGRHSCTSAYISDDIADEGMDVVAELVMAAINDATGRIEKESQKKVMDLTSEFKPPIDMGNIGGTGSGEGDA